MTKLTGLWTLFTVTASGETHMVKGIVNKPMCDDLASVALYDHTVTEVADMRQKKAAQDKERSDAWDAKYPWRAPTRDESERLKPIDAGKDGGYFGTMRPHSDGGFLIEHDRGRNLVRERSSARADNNYYGTSNEGDFFADDALGNSIKKNRFQVKTARCFAETTED